MDTINPSRYYLLIVGSRDFHDYTYFRRRVDEHIETLQSGSCEPVEIVIMTGRAPSGADDMAYHYAKRDRKLPLQEFKANWQEEGKRAGMLRNIRMVDYLLKKGHGEILAFWDGKSPGTQQCLTYAKNQGVPYSIDFIDPDRFGQPPQVLSYLPDGK